MNKLVKEEDKDNNSSRRKKKTVCDIVERMRNLVQRQEQEQFLAVLGKGEYKIVQEFRHLEVGDDYYRMTARQKEALKHLSPNRTTTLPLGTPAAPEREWRRQQPAKPISGTRKLPDYNGSLYRLAGTI